MPVVLDPERGFGEPTLPAGVRTETVAELVAAGEPPGQVAEMYGIGLQQVDAAVEYETQHRRSRAA